MGAAKKLIDKKVLRSLIPINALSAPHLEEVSRKAVIEEIRANTYVFKKGDNDNQTVYLLEGKVELLDEKRVVQDSVSAGSEAARHPLAHKQPRQVGARAVGKVRVARIDSSLLDVLLTWDESAGYDVVEIDGRDSNDDDWMTRMLQSQAFLQLPPSNIHQLLMRLEAVSVEPGDVIVRQGDEGDYFYIVKNGRLAVTRKASANSQEVLLAELGEGACFGEEALVSETRRNASVMMITAGTLMRLSKNDFNELLRAPLVHETDFEAARKKAAKGAQWLDVRLPGEFENQAIANSINIPLSALRERCVELDRGVDYIVCCDTGRRSAAAAFVLGQRGFNVFVLSNGLMDAPDGALSSFTNGRKARSETSAEIIPLENESREAPTRGAPREHSDGQEDGSDAALIDRLATAENDRMALRQQLERMQEKLQRAEQRAQGGAGSKTDSARQRVQAAEQRSDELEADLKRLKETLSQIQQAAEKREKVLRGELKQMVTRLETDLRHAETRSQELEGELGRLRDEHGQLQQHAQTLERERDEAAGAVQDLGQRLGSLQDSMERERSDNQQAQDSLRQTLGEREQALEALRSESGELGTRLEETENSRRQLEERLAEATEQAGQRQSQIDELQARLDEREQALQSREADADSAGRHIEQLQEQLGRVEQEAGERQRQRDEAVSEVERLTRHVEDLQAQLEQTRGDSAGERDTLQQRVEQLQQESEAQQQSLLQLQQERDAAAAQGAQLSAQLEELQQSLTEQQQQSAAQLTDAEQRLAEAQRLLTDRSGQEQALSSELQQRLEAAQAERAGLDAELEQLRQMLEEAQRRSAELEAQSGEQLREHESELTSSRDAMARAQTETENVQRENSRLLKRLEKAESKLQNQQQDHESELYRLRKQLKEAASESNAGLAAELESLQNRLNESERLRDDLEVSLGERSARLEEVQAQADTLDGQLRQAQDSARQAEQQLLESSRLANEEMAVRIDADEKARQALQEELAAVTDERNRSAEELTVRIQELEDTRALLEAAQRQESGQEQEAHEALNEAQRERDEAVQRQQELQQEIDLLRAETEAAPAMSETQSTGVDSEQQREALEQATGAAEAAERGRLAAEQRNVELQEEIEYLRAMVQADSAPVEPAASAQNEDDFYAEADPEPDPEVPESTVDETQPAGPETGDDGAQLPVPVTAENAPGDFAAELAEAREAVEQTASGGKGKVRLLTGIVLLALLAGAGWWWQQREAGVTEEPVAEQELSPVADAAEGDELSGADDAETVAVAEPSPQTAASGSDENKTVTVDEQDKSVKENVEAAARERPATIPDFSRGSSRPVRASSGDKAGAEGAGDANRRDSEGAQQSTREAARSDQKTAAKQAPTQPLRRYSDRLKTGGRGPVMVELEADSFLMGSRRSSANFDERPRHTVELKRFAISKHEVTFADYERFTKDTGRRLPSDKGWGRGKRPVINVSWKDAEAYVKWLSKQTGGRYRLPTEAEWEFAARSGGTARYWWGNSAGKGNANCFDCGSDVSGKTVPVGSFEASPFGIHDMAGNVMEWVQDCYVADYKSAPADGSAVSDGDCGRRVVRGGGYDSPSKSLRSAARDAHKPGTRLDNLGFRVVRER